MGFDNIAADYSGIYVQGRVIVPEYHNNRVILVRKYSHGGTELWNYVFSNIAGRQSWQHGC